MKNILLLTAFTFIASIGFSQNGPNPVDPPKTKAVRAVKVLTIFKLPTQTNKETIKTGDAGTINNAKSSSTVAQEQNDSVATKVIAGK